MAAQEGGGGPDDYERESLMGKPRIKEPGKWVKDDDIKTGRCGVCDQLVKDWSWKCKECLTRVCSECLDPSSGKIDYFKKTARNHLTDKCWHHYKWGFVGRLKWLEHAPGRETILDLWAKIPAGTVDEEATAARDAEREKARAASKAKKSKGKKKTTKPEEQHDEDQDDEDQDDEKQDGEDQDGEELDDWDRDNLGGLDQTDENDDSDGTDDSDEDYVDGEPQTSRKNVPEGTRSNADLMRAAERNGLPRQSLGDMLRRSSLRDRSSIDYSKMWADDDELEFDDGGVNLFEESTQRSSRKRKRGPDDDTENQDVEEEVLHGTIKRSSLNVSLKVHPEKLKETLDTSKTPLMRVPRKKQRFSEPLNMKPASIGKNIHEACTVIVGAGIVGLYTARALAKALEGKDAQHLIIVMDARSGPGQLASGHCNGFLSTAGMPTEWSELASVAELLWVDHFENEKIGPAIGNRGKDALFRMANGNGAEDEARRPKWLTGDDRVSLKKEECIGQIDPNRLIDWLMKECSDLDVRFMWNTTISDLKVEEGKLRGVRAIPIKGIAPNGNPFVDSSCSNLVLAAGAYTTHLLAQLVGHLPVAMPNYLRTAHWMEVEFALESRAVDDIGLRIMDAGMNDDQLQDEITVVATPPGEGIVRLAGYTAANHDKPLDVQDQSGVKLKSLKVAAAPYLRVGRFNEKIDKFVRASGRSDLSVGPKEAPVIDRLPRSFLGGPGEEEGKSGGSGGLWLCYGFGRFGTTLAPAAAMCIVEQITSGENRLVYCRIPSGGKAGAEA